MIFARGLLVAALAASATACGSGSTEPTAASSSRAAHVVFDDSQFSASACPKAHVLASCFSGTGSATLAGIGAITISRMVISGDQTRRAPAGCDPADTTGVLRDAHGGTAAIAGSGTLCGLLATYTLLVDHGTGSLQGLHVVGSITNNSGAESWDITTMASH